MARFTIKTRQHGEQVFFCPDGGGYVRLESGANHGTLGRQICYGGGFSGNTISATPESLPKVCRAWWAQQRRALADYAA